MRACQVLIFLVAKALLPTKYEYPENTFAFELPGSRVTSTTAPSIGRATLSRNLRQSTTSPHISDAKSLRGVVP